MIKEIRTHMRIFRRIKINITHKNVLYIKNIILFNFSAKMEMRICNFVALLLLIKKKVEHRLGTKLLLPFAL